MTGEHTSQLRRRATPIAVCSSCLPCYVACLACPPSHCCTSHQPGLASHLASPRCRFPFAASPSPCAHRLRQLAALFRVDWDAAGSEQLYALADMMNNAAAAADPPGVSEPLPAARLELPTYQLVMPAVHGNAMQCHRACLPPLRSKFSTLPCHRSCITCPAAPPHPAPTRPTAFACRLLSGSNRS
jgi:hypothetical protein